MCLGLCGVFPFHRSAQQIFATNHSFAMLFKLPIRTSPKAPNAPDFVTSPFPPPKAHLHSEASSH